MPNRKRIQHVTIKRMFDESPDTSWLGEYSNQPTGEFAIDRAHTLNCVANTGTATAETLCANCDQPKSHHNTTWLGSQPELLCSVEDNEELSDSQFEPVDCDCDERGAMGRNEYQYFNPGSVEAFNVEASWIPETITGETARRDYWRAAMKENARRDYERMEQLYRGDFCFIGIRAEAEVTVPCGQSAICQTITSGGLWGIESDSKADYLSEVEGEELSDLRTQLTALGFSKRAIATAVKNVTREAADNGALWGKQ